jgi:hypothetical protein
MKYLLPSTTEAEELPTVGLTVSRDSATWATAREEQREGWLGAMGELHSWQAGAERAQRRTPTSVQGSRARAASREREEHRRAWLGGTTELGQNQGHGKLELVVVKNSAGRWRRA